MDCATSTSSSQVFDNDFLQNQSGSLALEKEPLNHLQESLSDNISIWIKEIPYSVDVSNNDIASTVESPKPKHNNEKVSITDLNQFINLVDVTCLESGYYSEAERFIMRLCENRGYSYVLHLMNLVYIKHPKNELLMCSVINILSHMEYNELGDFVITLCMAMAFVGTPLVWEYVINACDSWNSMDFIECLEAIKTDSVLLNRMIRKVILRIKSRNERL